MGRFGFRVAASCLCSVSGSRGMRVRSGAASACAGAGASAANDCATGPSPGSRRHVSPRCVILIRHHHPGGRRKHKPWSSVPVNIASNRINKERSEPRCRRASQKKKVATFSPHVVKPLAASKAPLPDHSLFGLGKHHVPTSSALQVKKFEPSRPVRRHTDWQE